MVHVAPCEVRLLQVDAREPQELVDHANRADERLVADAAGSQSLVPQGGGAFFTQTAGVLKHIKSQRFPMSTMVKVCSHNLFVEFLRWIFFFKVFFSFFFLGGGAGTPEM